MTSTPNRISPELKVELIRRRTEGGQSYNQLRKWLIGEHGVTVSEQAIAKMLRRAAEGPKPVKPPLPDPPVGDSPPVGSSLTANPYGMTVDDLARALADDFRMARAIANHWGALAISDPAAINPWARACAARDQLVAHVQRGVEACAPKVDTGISSIKEIFSVNYDDEDAEDLAEPEVVASQGDSPNEP